MTLCAAHSMPYCRICTKVEKPAFGTVRKPLANKKREQTRMSADAQIQPGLGDRCILLGFMAGDCGERRQRCHIISQELIRETYKHGAWRFVGDEFWRPITNRETLPALENIERILLQQILDMSANLVPGCDRHNKDGAEMVDALDARKAAGLANYPTGFVQFCHEFRFGFNGSYWYWQPFESGSS